jgi:hypothetical protein
MLCYVMVPLQVVYNYNYTIIVIAIVIVIDIVIEIVIAIDACAEEAGFKFKSCPIKTRTCNKTTRE